jgi:hypothetical protein
MSRGRTQRHVMGAKVRVLFRNLDEIANERAGLPRLLNRARTCFLHETSLSTASGYLWHYDLDLLIRNWNIMSQSRPTRCDVALRVTRCPGGNKVEVNLGSYRTAGVMSHGRNVFGVETFWGTVWAIVTSGRNVGRRNIKAPCSQTHFTVYALVPDVYT